MKKITITLIVFTLFFGCSRSRERIINKTRHGFDLKTDIYNFSNKLENGDTIILNAKLGVCMSYCNEHNLIFKENNRIFIKSIIRDIYPNNDSLILGKAEYKFEVSDSLNFENLFNSLRNNTIRPYKSTSYTYQVIYKTDSLEFYPGNLINVLMKIRYYNKIKERIYPDLKKFKPVKVPFEEN